jgi:sec-independent protein translocase protein TatC
MKGDLGDLARRRGEMPFLEHLEELRWRILWSLLAVAVGAVVGFVLVYYFDVLGLLVHPLRVAYDDPSYKLINLSPADPFFITLKLGIVVGVILAFPIVVYQVWAFLSPALEDHEKKAIVPALYLGLVLFCAGVALAYFVALPLTLAFFQNFQAEFLEEQLEVSKTLAFITKLLIGFGVIFELPVVVMVLSALGLVTPEFLRSKRRHAMVAITVMASFLTPGDVITLTVMLMVPLFFLYEFSIYLSKLIWRRKRAGEEEEEARGEASETARSPAPGPQVEARPEPASRPSGESPGPSPEPGTPEEEEEE